MNFAKNRSGPIVVEQQLALQLFFHSHLILTKFPSIRFVTKSDDHEVDWFFIFKIMVQVFSFLVDLFVFILFIFNILVIVMHESYLIRTPPPSRVSISIIGRKRGTQIDDFFFFFTHLYRFHGFYNSYANSKILPKLTRSTVVPHAYNNTVL